MTAAVRTRQRPRLLEQIAQAISSPLTRACHEQCSQWAPMDNSILRTRSPRKLSTNARRAHLASTLDLLPKKRADLHVRLHRHVEPPWCQLLQLVGHGYRCHRGQREALHRCIGDVDEVRGGRTYKRASTILKELNIPRIDLLKMDIEVCRQRRGMAP